MVYLEDSQELWFQWRTSVQLVNGMTLTVVGKTALTTHTCHGTSPGGGSTCPRGPMHLLLHPTALEVVTGIQGAVVLLGWRLCERWWRRGRLMQARGGVLTRFATTSAESQLKSRAPAWSMASYWPSWALWASGGDVWSWLLRCEVAVKLEAVRSACQRIRCDWPRLWTTIPSTKDGMQASKLIAG